MGLFDDERAILRDVELVQDLEVCFLPNPTTKAVAFLSAIRNLQSWIKSERPDFYSDEQRLAIEVMRVDDHPKVGRVKNPTLAREAALEREIRGAFPSMNSDIPVVVVADTGLPVDKDHNFAAYRDAFARVVGNHAGKVEAYRESHPGYSLALLVHDESSAYAESEEASNPANSQGTKLLGRPHFWFLDSYFVQFVAQSGADFFFWHTPNKRIVHVDTSGREVEVELPILAVYDIAAMAAWTDRVVYVSSRIVNLEE